MLKRYWKISVIFIFFLSLSCNTSEIEPDPTRVGFNFFPLRVGDFRIYQVEEIDFSIFGDIDTNRFQLKEAVIDSFLNQTNEISYILQRLTRVNENQPWVSDSVWTARINQSQAIVVENNEPFIKLVFPVEEGKIWDGNKLNGRNVDEYEMKALFETLSLETGIIESSVTIIQNDNQDSIIMRDKRIEAYGINIGLVYKEIVNLQFCSATDCIGLGIIEQGRKLKQSIIDYGKE